jgi:hypothetical protein
METHLPNPKAGVGGPLIVYILTIMSTGGKFDASASMLGYLYQVRMALVLLLQRLKTDPSASVTLENFDDIAFHSGGNVVEQLQTKHVSTKSLADTSRDLWKTLRIWAEQFRVGTLAPSATSLTLLTTAEAPAGGAASYLRLENRSHGRALNILEQTATTSLNAANRSAYEEFMRLPKTRRGQLVRAIYVLDNSPEMTGALKLLHQELRIATTPGKVDAFATRIQGWWFEVVIEQLMRTRAVISGAELESELEDLREQFRLDNLPIDFADELVPNSDAYKEAKFVRQLQQISVVPSRISLAMLDYYRATRQRGRWIDDQMVHEAELRNFERRLYETWLNLFEAEKQECDGTEKEKTGRKIYEKTILQQILLRPSCTEPFIMRGSYHILADLLKLGWHPDFAVLMQEGAGDGK